MGQYYETFNPPFFMERRYWYNAAAVNAKSYDRPDGEIISDLKKRLTQLGPIDSKEVTVTCQKQVLTLNGMVVNQDVKNFLGRIADNVLGVRSVQNQLTIPRFGADTTSQAEIAKDIEREALANLDVLIPTTEPTLSAGERPNDDEKKHRLVATNRI